MQSSGNFACTHISLISLPLVPPPAPPPPPEEEAEEEEYIQPDATAQTSSSSEKNKIDEWDEGKYC